MATHTSILEDIGKDWNYFKFHPHRDVRLSEAGNNEYTPTIMASSAMISLHLELMHFPRVPEVVYHRT